MKIIKKSMCIIVLMIIIITLAYKTVLGYLSEDANITNMNANDLSAHENLYCVNSGQRMDSGITYYRKAIITIKGDSVYFCEQAGDTYGNITGKIKEGWGNTTEANNILAAILYNQQGYGDVAKKEQTDTQLGLFQYWETWRNASGAGKFHVYGNGKSTDIGASVLATAKENAEKYEYSVTIHYLTHVLHKKQALIAVYDVDREPKIPPKINIDVTKSWNDEDNKYENRTPITVDLLLNGVNTGKSLKLDAPNWKGTFTELENTTGYSIVESSGPNGYITSYGGNQSSGFTIENTLNRVNIKVTKKWDDDSNRDGKRPKSIIIQACDQNGTVIKEVEISKENSNVSADGNQWTYEFIGLPQYIKGVKIEYKIKEKEVPQEYYLVD